MDSIIFCEEITVLQDRDKWHVPSNVIIEYVQILCCSLGGTDKNVSVVPKFP